MAEYDESEYFTDSQEEIAEREAQEALRRMVRTEIRRVQTGAADADIAEDIAREEEQRAIEEQTSKRPRWRVWVMGVVTGDILLANEVKRVYTMLTILGIIFFAQRPASQPTRKGVGTAQRARYTRIGEVLSALLTLGYIA